MSDFEQIKHMPLYALAHKINKGNDRLKQCAAEWFSDQQFLDRKIASLRTAPDRLAKSLTMLANNFCKKKGRAQKEACENIAKYITKANDLSIFNSQSFSLLANAFSRWPDEPDMLPMKQACSKIAGHIRTLELDQFARFDNQHLSNLANAFSRWPNEPDMLPACRKIALQISRLGLDQLNQFNNQHFSNLANAFSKWPEQPEMLLACRKIALQINRMDVNQFHQQVFSNLTNAFSRWPEQPEMLLACRKIALHMSRLGLDQLNQFENQHLATLANAFSKWPEQPEMQLAVSKIAQQISRLRLDQLGQFNQQNLTNLANAFSKWPNQPEMQPACSKIAQQINTQNLDQFDKQHLANLANAFSKWPYQPEMQQAGSKIAGHISTLTRDQVEQFNQQELASLANSFSKWPEQHAMQEASSKIAQYINASTTNVSRFETQALTNLANAFSKWPENEAMLEVSIKVAQYINTSPRNVSRFDEHALTSLVNAFSKWPDNNVMKEVCIKIAEHINQSGQSLSQFNSQQLACLANGFSRLSMQHETEPFYAMLTRIADCIAARPASLNDVDLLFSAMLLKAYYPHPDLYLRVVRTLLESVQSLTAGDAGQQRLRNTNLETLGTLAMGLLPCFYKENGQNLPQADALTLLIALFPAVRRKVDLCTNPPVGVQEAYQSRFLALTYYQLIKVYEQVIKNNPNKRQKAPMQAWLEDMVTNKAAQVLELSPYSWNLIAKLEARFTSQAPDSIIDSVTTKHWQTLSAQHPPQWESSYQSIFDELGHAPEGVTGSRGELTLTTTDASGKPQGSRELNYSLLGRFKKKQNNQAPPVLEVTLPGQLSQHALNRLVYHNGQPYRMDVFGGNRMKTEGQTPKTILTGHTADNHGSLIAIPLSETGADAPFSQWMRDLFPYKESFFYFQRALLAAPKDNDPANVLEGEFKVQVFKDYAATEAHPFVLNNGVMLRPHDGAGFIKASMAERMAGVRSAVRPESHLQNPAVSGQPMTPQRYLPAQALQHYPSSAGSQAAVDREISAQLNRKIARYGQEKIPGETLFYLLTRGGISGSSPVGLPSSDGRIHWKTGAERRTGTVIGRAPYDQANLIPVAKEAIQVDDPTAHFLDQQARVIQYSFVGQNKPPESGGPGALWFAKGLFTVIPDESWPDHYSQSDMVLSAADIKTHTGWTETKRAEFQQDRQLITRGALVAVDVYAPGSTLAMPIEAQTRLSGDFDGDRVFVMDDGYEQVYQQVKAYENQHKADPVRVEKPAKTQSSALDAEGHYLFGRGQQINATKQQVLERLSGLQNAFLALSHRQREQVASATLDALRAKRPQDIAVLPVGSTTNDVLHFFSRGIKAGTDAYKSATDIRFFYDCLPIIQRTFSQNQVLMSVPYTKSLARLMAKRDVDIERIEKSLENNPTLAAEMMRVALATLKTTEHLAPYQNGITPPDPAALNTYFRHLSTLDVVRREDVHRGRLPAIDLFPVDATTTAVSTERKSRIIIVLENDAESLRSAMALAAKYPNECWVYQRDRQGTLRKIFGEAATLSGELVLSLVGHGRGGNDNAHNNTTLAGYSASELAAVTQQIHQDLSEQHVVHGPIDKLILAGCALVNDDQTGGFLFDMAQELLKLRISPRKLVGYSAEIGISGAESDAGMGHRHQVSQGVAGEPARQVRVGLQLDETGTRYLDVEAADKKLIERVDGAREQVALVRLKREVNSEIGKIRSVAGIEYRFKGFGETVEGKPELIFVAERTGEEKRFSSESEVFVSMQNKMRQLEPDIEQVEGVSTMNAAFLALNLLSRQGEQAQSPWKKFVDLANLGVILHGMAQDVNHLVNTVNTLMGAGTKAEGLLSRLLGGAPFTHAGSAVNVAVDILNFVDAINDLNAIPLGAQKDFALARVALTSTQLTVDGSLAILPVIATLAPATAQAITSVIGVAGPLSVVFAGLMMGSNGLLEAIAFNNSHYQVELDDIVAPFRHSKNKTDITPTGIAQVSDDKQGVYFEPYVPINTIQINGETLSVQVADIGIPRFNAATRAHSTTYAESLSAYRALGFTLSPTPQHEKLKSTQYLLLPAALKGHYTFMHDTGADGRLAGKAIFNRFGAYYHASDNGVFEISGDHAPNHVVFHPLATEYVIELDQGERIFAFQSPQEFTHIEGDDHEGLHSGRLPTPMIDAQHAHLLTYRFKGAGGTTRIDVFDDQRQIIIEPHKDPVQRKKEHWIVDITPDALDARVNREKAWLALRERTAIAYGDALLVLLNMGIDQAEVKKIHDQLVDRIRSKAQMSAEEMALLALLPLGFGVYTLIQSQADLLSDAKTPVNLSDLLAVAAPFIQKLNDRDQTTGTTLQQRHIAQLRLEQRDGGWDLQLTNNKKVRIDGDLPGDMGLRMRLAALPGVTVTFTLQKQGEETPKFSIGLEAENKDALLGDNLTTAVTFIREKFSDRTRFVVDDTVSVTLPLAPDQLPAKGWLNLTTVRWQVIQVEQPYLYCSNGTAVDTIELLGISCIARIKYDQDLKQPYVAAIVHPRDNLKTSVSYRYYPHLPAGQRYQQIEVIAFNESADQETQPLTQLIGAIYPHTSQAIIRVNSHTAALGAEYVWDGRQPFFKKIAWEQDNYHFIAERHDSVSPSTLMVIANPSVSPTEWAIHRLGADFAVKYRNALSSITLLLQDNTTRINLWGFPAIPINVFANVEAKIINPLPGSTFFLHSTELPGVTFKLSSLPPSNEQCLRWGLSLYAKDNAAVEGENRAEILRILRHHANNAVFPWVVDPAVPLSIGNHPDGEAEGVFELPPRLVSSETPAAAIGEIPDDSAGMREAMSTFEGGEREESPGARNEAHLPAPRILSGPGRSVALANF